MKSVARKQRKWKKKVLERREAAKDMVAMSEMEYIDVRVAMIQVLIPIGLQSVGRDFQKEVERLAGPRYEYGKANTRWGKQNGSVYFRYRAYARCPAHAYTEKVAAGRRHSPL